MPPPLPPSTHWARLAVGAAAALFVGMGLGRFSYTPFIPALVADGALSAAEAGTAGAFNLAGFLIGALILPSMRRRWGEHGTQRAALLLALLGLIASIAPWGFAWLALWRGLLGVAVGALMIQSIAVATRAAPVGKLGAAAGIAFTGVGAAILLAGLVVPELLKHGLAAAWTGIAVIGAAGIGLSFWAWRPGVPAAAASDTPPATVPSSGTVWRLIACQTLFTIGLIPHTIYWIDYLVRGLGHEMAFGGGHWALFGLGAMTGTYLWGRLADRIGFHAGLIMVFASLALSTVLPVLETAAWALVVSSLVVGAQPGCSALLSARAHQMFGAAEMPAIWRRMTISSGIGQGIGGYAVVALFEWSGSYLPVFAIGGAAFALGAVISAGLRKAAL